MEVDRCHLRADDHHCQVVHSRRHARSRSSDTTTTIEVCPDRRLPSCWLSSAESWLASRRSRPVSRTTTSAGWCADGSGPRVHAGVYADRADPLPGRSGPGPAYWLSGRRPSATPRPSETSPAPAAPTSVRMIGSTSPWTGELLFPPPGSSYTAGPVRRQGAGAHAPAAGPTRARRPRRRCRGAERPRRDQYPGRPRPGEAHHGRPAARSPRSANAHRATPTAHRSSERRRRGDLLAPRARLPRAGRTAARPAAPRAPGARLRAWPGVSRRRLPSVRGGRRARRSPLPRQRARPGPRPRPRPGCRRERSAHRPARLGTGARAPSHRRASGPASPSERVDRLDSRLPCLRDRTAVDRSRSVTVIDRRPADSACAQAGAPMVGMPRPTVGGAAGAVRASQASPERVRRWARTGPSATRWCGAAYVMLDLDDVARPAPTWSRLPTVGRRSGPAGCRGPGRSGAASRRPCAPRPRRRGARRASRRGPGSPPRRSRSRRRPGARSAPAPPRAAPGRAWSRRGCRGGWSTGT